MAIIEVTTEINATADRVWDVVSDLDGEPRFWKGTKSVTNISRDGDRITREVIIAFRDQRCLQEVTVTPKEKIEARFTEGIISGVKTMSLVPQAGGKATVLKTYWDIRMTGMMGMFTGMIKKHIRNGTEQAMRSIKDEVERGNSG